ncbi:MAG: choice-of-anchor D domain-containing protein, partial [Eggerthellaceae bacterium]|nr:choice-of-anchor D domain-containing protein [Eggerthellaceae bacterium]
MMHAYKQRTSFKATIAFVISLVLTFTLLPAFSFAHAANDLDFGSYEVGYGDAQSATITVQNPNNRQMTLSLAKLEGEFEIETALPTTMAARSSYTVVVRPKSNLPVGTYNGSISFQLKGALGLTATTPATKLSFTVTEEKQAPAPSTQLDFGTKKAGYAPEARTVTVYNPTNQTVDFTLKSIADGFEVVRGLPQNVAPWSNIEVEIAPKAGLSAGTYEGAAVIQSKTAAGARATTSVGLKFVVEDTPAQEAEIPASKYGRQVTFFGQVNLPDGSVKYYKDAQDGYTVSYTNEAQVEQIQELTEADAKALAAEEEAYKQWFVSYGMSEEDFEKQVEKKAMSSLRLINENPSRSIIGASFSNSLTFDAPAQAQAHTPTFSHHFYLFGSITEADGTVKYYKDAKDGISIDYANDVNNTWKPEDEAAYNAEREAFAQWFADNGVSEEELKKVL